MKSMTTRDILIDQSERIKNLESVLTKLIAWSVRDLGLAAAQELLDELATKQYLDAKPTDPL
jgi:hypothetical protein